MRGKKKFWITISIVAILSIVAFILSPAPATDAEISAALFEYYKCASTNGFPIMAPPRKIPGGYGKKPTGYIVRQNVVAVGYQWTVGDFRLVRNYTMYR